MAEHGGQIFHRFIVEADIGDSREGTITTWDMDGWVGGDIHKLQLKSEGEAVEGNTHQAEFQALYSRNISEFWDAQAGIRHDTQPESTTYFAAGVEGLAPYFIETEAHLFISDEADISARIHTESELLVTQQLVLQPYMELNLFAQEVRDRETGAGLANGEIGLQTRYEFTRNIAPYIDLRYERKFGATASLARRHGEPDDDFIASTGLRLMF